MNIPKRITLKQRKMWQALNPAPARSETDSQRLLRILRTVRPRSAK
jgi:hypothetical protein